MCINWDFLPHLYSSLAIFCIPLGFCTSYPSLVMLFSPFQNGGVGASGWADVAFGGCRRSRFFIGENPPLACGFYGRGRGAPPRFASLHHGASLHYMECLHLACVGVFLCVGHHRAAPHITAHTASGVIHLMGRGFVVLGGMMPPLTFNGSRPCVVGGIRPPLLLQPMQLLVWPAKWAGSHQDGHVMHLSSDVVTWSFWTNLNFRGGIYGRREDYMASFILPSRLAVEILALGGFCSAVLRHYRMEIPISLRDIVFSS